MFYNWEFTLKECEEGQEENGVFIGGYELDVCVLEEKHSAKPVTNVCKSFAGIAEEDMKNSKLTLAELIFLEYAIAIYLNPVDVFTAYSNLCQKLVPIAAVYLIDLKNLNKRVKYTKRIWWLNSYGSLAEEIPRSGHQLLNIELNNSTMFKLAVAPVEFSQYGDVVLGEYSDRIEMKNLPQNIPEIVKCFYNTVRWRETNPRQIKEMSKLCDELERLEKVYEFLLENNIPVEKISEQLFYMKENTVISKEDLKLGQSDQYNYLILFQDLIAPQTTPMVCRWVGSFEVQHLYNVTVWRTPAKNFGLMFAVDSNVELDAVRAGAQGSGLAARLSALAVQPLDSKHPEYDQICEQFRAVFE